MPDYQHLLYDVADRVCTITFNRPDKRNALNTLLLEELDDALNIAEADDEVRVLLFKGSGTAFSAGYDLKDNPYTVPPEGQEKWRLNDSAPALRKISDRYLRLWYYPKPTVAQVQGSAIATGCYFQMLCDISFAANTATFGHQAQRVGGVTSLPLWVWMLGMRQAKYLLMTGRLITANEAQKIGLITRVFEPDDLEGEVNRLCADLAQQNPTGARWLKEAINADYDMMGLRAAFPMHHSMNAAMRMTEAEPGALSLTDIVFGGNRQDTPEET
jgi:enoyl-CoA hydratase